MDQCPVVRFEKRAKECIFVARLSSTGAKPQGNQHARNHLSVVRGDVSKGVESPGCEPKPGDLSVGKVKRRETDVEAC